MKIHLVSLGCARNLIDSETMLGTLKNANFEITDDPTKAQIIIVNTCGFIESATQESIDTILELGKQKETGNCKKLIVVGCLAQRYKDEIADLLPEVDIFLGTQAFNLIDKVILNAKDFENKDKSILFPDPDSNYDSNSDSIKSLNENKNRIISSDNFAYLKITEGCLRHCSFCIIPKLRGKQKSRNPDYIINETKNLIKSNFREIILIGQETTSYGMDLKNNENFSDLLNSLSLLSEDTWLRILYGHPESISDEFIKTIANNKNICSYYDIPIQHVNDLILRKMGRNYTKDYLYKLVDKIRTYDKNAIIRTSLIVGFPQETEKHITELIDFIKWANFDHLGVFTYSDSDDLKSHLLSDHVKKNIAKKRYDRIMSLQQKISLNNNKKHIGKTYKVLVEQKTDENVYIGRTYFQAPEIDGVVYIESKNLKLGNFIDVKVTNSLEYDLIGAAL